MQRVWGSFTKNALYKFTVIINYLQMLDAMVTHTIQDRHPLRWYKGVQPDTDVDALENLPHG